MKSISYTMRPMTLVAIIFLYYFGHPIMATLLLIGGWHKEVEE